MKNRETVVPVDRKPPCLQHPRVNEETPAEDIPKDCEPCQKFKADRLRRRLGHLLGAPQSKPLAPPEPPKDTGMLRIQLDRLRATATEIAGRLEWLLDETAGVEARLADLERAEGKDPEEVRAEQGRRATEREALEKRVDGLRRRLDQFIVTAGKLKLHERVELLEARVLPPKGGGVLGEEQNLVLRLRALEGRTRPATKRK